MDANANITSVTEINGVLYGDNCPFDYCADNPKNVDYMGKNDTDDHCVVGVVMALVWLLGLLAVSPAPTIAIWHCSFSFQLLGSFWCS